MLRRQVFCGTVTGFVGLCLLLTAAAGGSTTRSLDPPPWAHSASEPADAVHHDVSPPLRDLAPAPDPDKDKKKEKEPKKGLPVPGPSANDPVIQATEGSAAAPALGLGFDGVGQGFTGPSGTYTVNSAPPDPNGAVGPNHFVEIVNSSFAIFDKAGTPLYGPVTSNTLWSGFGGGCQSNNDGDATVAYDRLADRWVISQFSVSSTPDLQCVAVSTSGDPTGTYYRYAFQYNNFPDYPKLGVWPDAYYTTFNMFNNAGTQFLGPEVCAYDRAKMMLGQAATQQCFTLGSSFGGLLPSDLDGSAPPPAGSPNYVVSFGTNVLQLWKFHVDWTTPGSSTFTGPTQIPVASFSPACNGGGTCIPQAGTSRTLDSLADRLMYRFAYRNFGDHESLVVNHSVTAGSSVGVRWYELRNPGGTPTVYQQGTYAPDSSYRWMGSIAMDRSGDIALGFSISSSSLKPGIHYTGRLAGDTLGLMTQGEGTIVDGNGAQTGTLSRWGDYTSMSVDPSDDCTFWYTGEYLAANGTFNWHTRIGSFKFPSCGGGGGTSDFSIGASPGSLSVAQGASGTSTISTAVTSGSAQTVALSASGAPAGTTVSFNPASVSAGGSSTMTVSVGSSTATGSYTITVTGTGTSATHTTTVGLTVTAAGGSQGVVNGGFETGNLSGWSASGAFTPVISTTPHSGSYSARLGSTSAFNGNSTLTQTVALPAGNSQLTYWYQPHCTDSITYDQIQMQVRSTSGATLATVMNVCSNSGAWTQVSFDLTPYAGQSIVLWFNDHDDNYPTDPTYFLLDDVAVSSSAPPPSDFSIGASPSSLSVVQGSSGTSTISTAVTSGSAQSVALSASGAPAGTTVSFNPASVTAGGSSTMTVSVGSSTATGSYTITVSGTGTSATHTTTVSLTVTAPPPPSDFSIGASPSSLSVAQGSSGTSTISTVVTSGSAQTVALSASGAPAGTTVSFNPSSVTAGGSSTMTVTVGSSTATGSYTITVTGTGTSATHTTTVALTVTAATARVVNGGFETGTLSGWSASGAFTPVISTTRHSGSYAARLGSTSPFNGNSILTQSVTVPGGSSTLTFWYQPHCTDSITYDQIQMQVRSTSGATLATVLNVCSNSGIWTQVSFNMTPYAGQTVVLWFNDHDDNYPTDPTYFLLDDVALG